MEKRVYIVKELLSTFKGEDIARNGLRDTPKRVAKAWEALLSGYAQDIGKIFTFFDREGYDEVVLLRNCEFISVCEHHMLPFFGKAHIAYLPGDNHVLGISKLARLLDMYARRLQNQERIGEQVTKALMGFGKARGAACILEAKHLCMMARGVEKKNSSMVTASLQGSFKTDHAARNELYQLINSER